MWADHHLRVVLPTPERFFHMANRLGSSRVTPHSGAVAQHLGNVDDGVSDLGGGQCTLVLERECAGGHEPGQLVCHGGSHGQWAADVGSGQEELG